MGFKIEYDIKLNDEGRPYIDISNGFNDIPEHRFFAFEITKYVLFDLIDKNKGRSANSKVSEDAMKTLENTAASLHSISNEMAKLIRGIMDNDIDINELIKKTIYDITVDRISDLEDIKNSGFVFNDKIYTKKHALKVRVLEDMCVYELQGETPNDHWVNITPNQNQTDEEDSTNETQS